MADLDALVNVDSVEVSTSTEPDPDPEPIPDPESTPEAVDEEAHDEDAVQDAHEDEDANDRPDAEAEVAQEEVASPSSVTFICSRYPFLRVHGPGGRIGQFENGTLTVSSPVAIAVLDRLAAAYEPDPEVRKTSGGSEYDVARQA